MPILKVHRKKQSPFFFWGVGLTQVREELGLTEEEFATKCGYKQQNQQQLEKPGIEHHLDLQKIETFGKLGITFQEE